MPLVRMLILHAAAFLVPALAAAQTCPPPSTARADLLSLRERGFAIENETAREALAMGLLACLASPDPELRDGVAFEALSTWMRGGQLSVETATAVLDSLLPRIAPAASDPDGFERSFSALILSEVARMDRIEPFLPAARLEALVAEATSFLQDVDDYRGYDERVGWRHAVAHGADLMLQLSLNARVDAEQLRRILDALATQVAPPGEHFYIYGEPSRLARAVYYVAARDLLAAEEWEDWLSRVTDPAPLGGWDEAFQSQEGLAKRHNTAGLLLALYLMVDQDTSVVRERVMPALMEAIGRVP
jgi:hypothetical protein